MKNKILLVFLLSFITEIEGSGQVCSSTWDYNGKTTGPLTWADKYSRTCGGKKQSPIDLMPEYGRKGSGVNMIRYHNYHVYQNTNYTFINNGHSIQLDLPSNHPYRLLKGYTWWVPLQVHIHSVSEHAVYGKKYIAEIHIVHRNIKYTASEAVNETDGLLVLGVFVDKPRRDSTSPSYVMKVFGEIAEHVIIPGHEFTVPGFPLGLFLPTRLHFSFTNADYINYAGSLTTPPCTENVDWVVFTKNTLSIPETAIKKLKKVKACPRMYKRYKPLFRNNRPLQRRNGRQIYYF